MASGDSVFSLKFAFNEDRMHTSNFYDFFMYDDLELLSKSFMLEHAATNLYGSGSIKTIDCTIVSYDWPIAVANWFLVNCTSFKMTVIKDGFLVFTGPILGVNQLEYQPDHFRISMSIQLNLQDN